MKPSFNLIDEPWIPCMPIDGDIMKKVSITEALTNASAYRDIYDNSPLVTVSLHRLLLAILYRACGPCTLREARTLITGGLPADAILLYLEKWRDRFDLFDEDHPFYQTAGLMIGKNRGKSWDAEPVSIIRIITEAPDKNQPVLFDHRTYSIEMRMALDDVARCLVAIQSYAKPGGVASNARLDRGGDIATPNNSGGPGIGSVWCWLSGCNLHETLLLNLIPQEHNDFGTAAWERDKPLELTRQSWTTRQLPEGFADRYTWQSRLINLVPNETADDTTVSLVHYTQGRVLSPEYVDDPMCAYVRKIDRDPWRSISLQKDKAVWRDAHALLQRNACTIQPRAIEHVAQMILDRIIPSEEYMLNVVGMATDRAKCFLWRHDRLPAPAVLLQDASLVERLERDLKVSETAGSRLNNNCRILCANYLIPGFNEMPEEKKHELLKSNPKHPTDIDRLSSEIDPRRNYWAKLEGHFYILLQEMPLDKESASVHWHESVSREADSAFSKSAEQLGQSSRAIRARAIVHPAFNLRPNGLDKETDKEEVTI